MFGCFSIDCFIKVKRILAIVIVLSLIFIFQKFPILRTKNTLPVIKTEEVSNPVRLRIPTIQVDAKVESVGVTDGGEMAVPDDMTNVGWFEFGPRPGEIGSAVIDGHFDTKNGEPGVFFDLYKLKKGDKVEVVNSLGLIVVFVVKESRLYAPGYTNEVFNQADGAHLNLITCDGVWDGSKKSFTKRLVIYTDLVK